MNTQNQNTETDKDVASMYTWWEGEPKSITWVNSRLAGMRIRANFTEVLAQYGCSSDGFASCTEAIYLCVTNMTSKRIRKRRDVGKKCLRDALTSLELATITFAESLAVEHIIESDAFGDKALLEQTLLAGMKAAEALNV